MSLQKFVLTTALLAAFCQNAICGSDGSHVENVDVNYIRSLANDDKTVLVVEYRDGNDKVVSRKGFANKAGFKPASPTEIAVNDNFRIKLFGVSPCAGDISVESDDFHGSCADYAKEQLAIQLKNPRVIYCIASVVDEQAAVQNGKCWGYWFFPGSLNSVSSIEAELLSVGAVKLAKKPDGSAIRPDLVNDEEIGRRGALGVWSETKK